MLLYRIFLILVSMKGEIIMDNWFDKNKFFESVLVLSWFSFLFFCLFLLSFTSHAASDQDYFPMFQNHNNKFTSDVINKIETQFDSTNNYIFCRWDSYSYNRNNIFVLVWPKSSGVMLYGEKYNY